MAKYGKNDCRNSAGLGKTVSDYPKMFIPAPAYKMHNRHEKRTSAHFSGRKNTSTLPDGHRRGFFCLV